MFSHRFGIHSMRVGHGSSEIYLEVFVEFLQSLDLVVQDAIHILERIVVVIDHHGKITSRYERDKYIDGFSIAIAI